MQMSYTLEIPMDTHKTRFLNRALREMNGEGWYLQYLFIDSWFIAVFTKEYEAIKPDTPVADRLRLDLEAVFNEKREKMLNYNR